MLRGLLQGDRVKLTLVFKGREMQFQEIGRELFQARACTPAQCFLLLIEKASVFREGVLSWGVMVPMLACRPIPCMGVVG